MLAFLYCKVLCMYLPTWKWLLSQSGNLTTLYLITPRDFYPPTQHDGATSVCRCFLLLCKFNVLSNLWPFQVMQFSYWSSTHFLWTQTHKKTCYFQIPVWIHSVAVWSNSNSNSNSKCHNWAFVSDQIQLPLLLCLSRIRYYLPSLPWFAHCTIHSYYHNTTILTQYCIPFTLYSTKLPQYHKINTYCIPSTIFTTILPSFHIATIYLYH